MNRLKQGITIVISAWQVQDFIEECLDSILKQKHFNFNQLEVIVGIDGCKQTLNKIKEIQGKYTNLNLRVYWFKKNSGTYITTNTIVSMARFNNILRFDADDYMLDNMIHKIMAEDQNYNVIEFKLINFDNNTKEVIETKISEGCRFFTKELLMSVGGYMPWRHSADSELLIRTKSVVKKIRINEPLFMRRIHSNSLTQTPKTCLGSKNRMEYRKLMTKNLENGIVVIQMIINDKYEVIIVNEYKDNQYEICTNFAIENQLQDYVVAISEKPNIINVFFNNHKTIITYSSVIINYKDLQIINKYYKQMKKIMINYKELILWKRYK